MKKIIILTIIMFLTCGCQKENINNVKSYPLELCNDVLFDKAIDSYLTNAKWEENQHSFQVSGKNVDNNNIIIEFSVKDEKILIEKYIVNKKNLTEKYKESLLTNICPNYVYIPDNNENDNIDNDNNETNNNTVNNNLTPPEEISTSNNTPVEENKPASEKKEEITLKPIEVDPQTLHIQDYINNNSFNNPVSPPSTPNKVEPPKDDTIKDTNSKNDIYSSKNCQMLWLDEDGIGYSSRITLNAKNNIITKYTLKHQIGYKPGYSKEELENLNNELQKEYLISGVDIKLTLESQLFLYLTTTIDFQSLDVDTYNKIFDTSLSKDADLELTIANLKEAGYSC